jgi:SAM-dependent methyltransferase
VTAESYESTRAAYDTVAADYHVLLRDRLGPMALDRAMLGAFAELVLADGGARVADLGCGPGHITGHLHALGLDVFGIDLSAAMISVARQAFPHLSFEAGSMAALDLADGRLGRRADESGTAACGGAAVPLRREAGDRSAHLLGGIVAWYSVIHTPPEHQPALYREFARVLRPHGHLLLAFQVGDERVHLERAYGHDVSLDVYRLSPDDISGQLAGAGFEVTARLIREPIGPERQRQAFLLARKG